MIGESDAGRSLVIVQRRPDTASFPLTRLDTAKRFDVVVYGVSVGARVRFLRDLSVYRRHGVRRGQHRKLAATFEKILDEFRHRYLVSYAWRTTRGGW